MPNKLANRYRPHTWDKVVGQEHITDILSNTINKGRILPTGMVFSAVPGSGKTTLARIAAKAINCTGETKPCEECENCKMFNTLKSDGMPSHPDYYEVDGTTYGGKSDIESLLELASTSTVMPGENAKRIILIDECHRLSAAGWDVLLKPLEEGLKHTIFMFATTDVDKIRKAILSRCPTYAVKPLSQKKLYGYLKYILESEELEYDEKSLVLLSYNYVGRTRDAVTEMSSYISAYDKFTDYSELSVYESILMSILSAYNKDLDSAYDSAKENIAFKSNNIGADISETILAIYTKNKNIIRSENLNNFIEMVGNNLHKIMSIFLNNNINSIDKFILALCMVSDLNKMDKKVTKARYLKKNDSKDTEDIEDKLISSGKFN